MKALSSSVRLGIFGLCLIAALAAACSFDTSQLRTLASSAPDGAVEHPVVSDAPTATGGSGGSAASAFDAPTATGGSGGTTASPPDAPTIAGGNGGYAGVSGTGGAGRSGGQTAAGGTGGTGAVGGSAGTDAGAAGSSGGGSGGYAGVSGTGGAGRSGSQTAAGGTGGTGAVGGTAGSDAGMAGSGSGGSGGTSACNLVAPTGVTATPLSQQVRLNWTAVANATSYNIGRSLTSGTGYTSAGTATAPAVTFLDTDPTLTNGTKYYYVVTASNSICTSPSSTEVSATPACVLPAVPTGVTATADNSNGHINLSWGTVNGATAYTVSRGTASGGPFTAVSTNQTAATYADSTGLTAGTVYYYVVSASNAGGTCASTNSTPAVSARSCTLPSVPSGVSATAGISRVTVRWTASSGSPTSYEVKRGTASGGPFTSIGTPTASPYVDSGVTNGTTYYYVVAARNAGGACSSANSGVASAAPRSCTVWSGNAVSSGHPPAIGTLSGICYVTCDPITNWACANTDGRSITINGGPLACSAGPIPAAKTPGYYVIDVSAGTYTGAQVFWGASTWVNNCSIPSGGLDF